MTNKTLLLGAALGVALIGTGLAMKAEAPRLDYEKATVLVRANHGHGSGVMIDARRVLTAAHVAKEANAEGRVDIQLGENDFTTAVVAWFDETSDVALLILDGPIPDAQPARLVCSEPDAVVGDALEAVGNPLWMFNVHTWGRVSANTRVYDLKPNTILIADMTIAPGNSGGPVFTAHHTVAGITNAMASTVLLGTFPALFPLSIIVPTSVLCHQLAIEHPAPVLASQTPPAPEAPAPAPPAAPTPAPKKKPTPINIAPKIKGHQ